MKYALVATMAALALAPTAALASSDGPPLTESTSNCSAYPGGLACIPADAVCIAALDIIVCSAITDFKTDAFGVAFQQEND
jgi:hypothetical protein